MAKLAVFFWISFLVIFGMSAAGPIHLHPFLFRNPTTEASYVYAEGEKGFLGPRTIPVCQK